MTNENACGTCGSGFMPNERSEVQRIVSGFLTVDQVEEAELAVVGVLGGQGRLDEQCRRHLVMAMAAAV
jgi:hypothetical protein